MFPVLLIVVAIFAVGIVIALGSVGAFAIYEIIEFKLEALDIALFVLVLALLSVLARSLFRLIRNKESPDNDE